MTWGRLANGLFWPRFFSQYNRCYLGLQSQICWAVSFKDLGGSSSVISFDPCSTTYDFQMLPTLISHLLPEAILQHVYSVENSSQGFSRTSCDWTELCTFLILKIHFTSAWFFHFISVLFYFYGKLNTLTNGLLLYSHVHPWHTLEIQVRETEQPSAALRHYDTSHLQNDVLPLLWQVHLKPISSGTDDDGDDIEQTTKALQGGNYFLSAQELFLLYRYVGLRFIKGNGTILFSSQPFPSDRNRGMIIFSSSSELNFSDYFSYSTANIWLGFYFPPLTWMQMTKPELWHRDLALQGEGIHESAEHDWIACHPCGYQPKLKPSKITNPTINLT